MSKYSSFFASYNASVKNGNSYDREEIIAAFTDGRTTSLKELTDAELNKLVNILNSQNNIYRSKNAGHKMRRKIISMAHEMGWHNLINGKWVADMRSINTWCLQKSYLKKELNKYTYNELPKLVSQFENVYKSFLKKV